MNPLMRCIVLASMLLSGVTVAFVMIAPGIALVDDGESGSLGERLSGAGCDSPGNQAAASWKPCLGDSTPAVVGDP